MKLKKVVIPDLALDLDITFTSGQTFRWVKEDGGWDGVLNGYWVRLVEDGVEAARGAKRRPDKTPRSDLHVFYCASENTPIELLKRYFRLDEDYDATIRCFPDDPVVIEATNTCYGMRLLRQDPWECLACFILSSTKRISQIEEIVRLLCQRYGETVLLPPGHRPVYAFPKAKTLALLSEADLRACKMGFRAPSLLAAARHVAEGKLLLEDLRNLDIDAAREKLGELRGVGPKIADCVLLFSLGFEEAFPVDVWIARILRQKYFAGKDVGLVELREFVRGRFGSRAGFVQQMLFHHFRISGGN